MSSKLLLLLIASAPSGSVAETTLVGATSQGERKLRKASFFCGEQYSYLGCYADVPYDRAMVLYGEPMTYYQCAKACQDAGYAYMGRQYTEQCFCGNDASDVTGFAKHGEAEGCDCSTNTENIGEYKQCVYDVSQDFALSVPSAQDTEIKADSPDVAYGSTLDKLGVVQSSGCSGTTKKALIEFDLTEVNIDPTCATLRLFVPDTSTGIRKYINVARLDEGFIWDEGALTWDSYHNPPPSGTLGVTKLFVKEQTDRNQFVEVDVSDLMAGQTGKRITLVFETDSYENNVAIGCNTIEFTSRDGDPDKAPELVLTAGVPSPSPGGSPGGSPGSRGRQVLPIDHTQFPPDLACSTAAPLTCDEYSSCWRIMWEKGNGERVLKGCRFTALDCNMLGEQGANDVLASVACKKQCDPACNPIASGGEW